MRENSGTDNLSERKLSDLKYVDDVMPLDEDQGKLQASLDQLNNTLVMF